MIDFTMGHFDELVATRLVSFRDLMGAVLDIEQKIIKGREVNKDDPLALYERWWTKPDVIADISAADLPPDLPQEESDG